jgi:hypothetical protein
MVFSFIHSFRHYRGSGNGVSSVGKTDYLQLIEKGTVSTLKKTKVMEFCPNCSSADKM